MITKDDADRILNSWKSLSGKEIQIFNCFLETLFKTDPDVRLYFPKDMNKVQEKFLAVINQVINNINELEALIPEFHQLGSFFKYKVGVEMAHYPLAINVLILSIRNMMGKDFNNEIGESWRRMLVVISTHMLKAPREDRSLFKHLKEYFSS